MSELLDKVIPAPPVLVNAFTGEMVDRDDAEAIAAALVEIDEFLDGVHAKHRAVYKARADLRARLGELRPTDLPQRRSMTKQQELIERCPRCRTRLPRTVITEAD